MKTKRTMRDIKSQYPTIIQIGYCDLQNMLCMDDPAAYTAGVYGWNAEELATHLHNLQMEFVREVCNA